MINFEEYKDCTFLIGGYKSDQRTWIWGTRTKRNSILYDVRLDRIGGIRRPGAIRVFSKPDYVVMYGFGNPSETVRFFKCERMFSQTEEDMRNLQYLHPHGDYIVYELGEEIDGSGLDICKLIQMARKENPSIKMYWPFILFGAEIKHMLTPSKPSKKSVKKTYEMIDLFAGLGGFHLAMKQVGEEMGFRVGCHFASELRADLRTLYSENYKVSLDCINPDITLLDSEEKIRERVPEHEILCGGFPCQPFSKAGKQQGFDDEEGRGVLFNYIEAIIKERRPKYVFLENVANLKTHDGGNTWKVIREKLENLNYTVKDAILSPHQFGFPQHRSRIYIVAVDNEKGNLFNFDFPKPQKGTTSNIADIIESNPVKFTELSYQDKERLSVWQEFVDLCVTHNVEMPHPVWAMEFGATYPYEHLAPAFHTISELKKYKGQFGQTVTGATLDECLSCLPNYSQTNKSESFPKWKIGFIKKNRQFYEQNKEWLDPWIEKIKTWENSFIKFEWNCLESKNSLIEDKIVQFRPSGIRVKMPTHSPALTYVGSQIPMFPWIEWQKTDGTTGKGRYMTIKEAAAVQGMQSLSFTGLSNNRIFEALGNAVDVEVIKLIVKNIIRNENCLNCH